MKLKFYMLILLIFATICDGQTLIQVGEIGGFQSAVSFSYNPAGFFYVSDDSQNEIFKIDTLGNIIKSIGGFGWDNGSFDDPNDIYSNVLNIYVADKNNNRIQIFDKDLNYISKFQNSDPNDDYSFRYPTCVASSNQGDLFILDSDNRRIVKYNRNGDFITSIGGIDAGEFQLTNPKKFCIDENYNLLVLDSNSIFIFDEFGNGLKKLQLQFGATNLNALFDNLLFFGGNSIQLAKNSTTKKVEFVSSILELDKSIEIRDAVLFNSKIYILTNSAIYIYQIIGAN